MEEEKTKEGEIWTMSRKPLNTCLKKINEKYQLEIKKFGFQYENE